MIDRLLLNINKQLNNFFEITEADSFALNAVIAKANNETIDCLHKVNNKYCLNTSRCKHIVLQWIYNIFVQA